jgi:hypothetical protein
MVVIGCVRCEKFRSDFGARTFALIAPFHPVLHLVFRSNEMVWNAPNHYETHQNMSLRSICVDRVRSLRKFRSNFIACTFALVAPVRPVLQWVSWSNETVANAPKYYVMHQNMSLGSNGVDRVRSLRKIPKRFRCTNFCINCTSSFCFAPSFEQ